MKIINCIQNSPEWFAAKCGIPSASSFNKIITSSGKPSEQRKKYMYQLIGEKLSGTQEESYQNAAMLRGKEMEEEARSAYEFISGNQVEKCGFFTNDSGEAGASPDGLVDKDGSIEIKCPQMSTHVGYLLQNSLPSDYFQQTQGQLYITERKWVDFVSYYPGIKPLIIRVNRDTDFIKALDKELKLFYDEMKSLMRFLK